MRCSNCIDTFYCSRMCQVQDWPQHCKICGQKRDAASTLKDKIGQIPSSSAVSTNTTQVSTPQRQQKVKVRKQSPKLSPKEKRLRRYRSQPTNGIRQRIQRALTQRLYLVKTSDIMTCERHGGSCITFKVLGSTGNVYEVKIAKVPDCSCPDHQKGNLCKHLLFVMLKVVGLDSSSPLVYQSAYITQELEEIMQKVQSRMTNVGIGNVVANKSVIDKLNSIENGDEETKVVRQEIEGNECPICFDDLGGKGNMSHLTFCKATCGMNFHKECINMWTKEHINNPTCPACRQKWIDTETGGKRSNLNENDEGYVNLGSLQGQSPERDTSTYFCSWSPSYRYKRRRY